MIFLLFLDKPQPDKRQVESDEWGILLKVQEQDGASGSTRLMGG